MNFKHYKYNFKWDELGWFVLSNAAVMLGTWYLTFDPTLITDWKTWLISAAISGSRVIIASALAYVVPKMLGAGDSNE